VDRLWDSLDDSTYPHPSEEWLAEIDQRCREIDEGKAKLVPGEQVMREAQEKLEQMRRR